MIRITYVEDGGTRHTVTAQAGRSLMQIAVENGVPGIDADCGGSCVCATCHIHVDTPWSERLAPPDEVELTTLEFAVGAEPRTSRLSCQIAVSEALDGIEVRMPSTQR
ncbi:2Fe-2S iron-sulfur cluster-binding protein [Variovorax sp. Sphag1AA]|uniref:2Fe-2S iron-sulfur cluster-binding protein n=1 Tax=Variovorax sp. Sphag1AA TaxID=2587027 RepID=UPI00162201A3|nr:2Fe-2S iron-sulfur cluster-binding protein [Variovorax sp. Sphag1AA]MBB3181338.1 2Fe-2S ferredoxin [Variovorax sp. Sphag1AA]